MNKNNNNKKIKLYSPREIAERLSVGREWLRLNQRGPNPMPSKRYGYRTIKHAEHEVLDWIGCQSDVLKFYSTKQMAKLIGLSERWLWLNRKGPNPMPHYLIDGLIRYHAVEAFDWFDKNYKTHPTEGEPTHVEPN